VLVVRLPAVAGRGLRGHRACGGLELCAVLGFRAGHYTCLVAGAAEHTWWLCNDAHVRAAGLEEYLRNWRPVYLAYRKGTTDQLSENS
jgi:hypothetical protein